MQGFRAAADDGELTAGQREGERDQRAEFARPDHHHPVGRADLDLLLDFQRGGQRFGKNGGLIGDGGGDRVEVFERQGEVLGERAVAALNAQHGAAQAVGVAPGAAFRARAAGRVDFAAHALAAPFVRPLFHHPHELVAERAAKIPVALHQFEIGVANAGLQHADQGFAGRRDGAGLIGAQGGAGFESQGQHGVSVHFRPN